MSLVECVPNFSEGRRRDVVQKIVDSIASVDGAHVIDWSMDASHNRSVVTFVAPVELAAEAAFRGIAEAKAWIDLRFHRGEHKRIGATDVVPFVPLEGALMPKCIELAYQLGERVGRELEIPIYFYAAAARRPERRLLPEIRKGEFEGLRETLGRDPARTPDAGPNRIHPTAGATVVGARSFLIAYNINLESCDVETAKQIAKKVREKDGGLPGIQAMGFFIDELNCAQVSMNLLDFEVTGIQRIFEEVEALARAQGIGVKESELVGLAPRAALPGEVARRVKLRGFEPTKQIIEELLPR